MEGSSCRWRRCSRMAKYLSDEGAMTQNYELSYELSTKSPTTMTYTITTTADDKLFPPQHSSLWKPRTDHPSLQDGRELYLLKPSQEKMASTDKTLAYNSPQSSETWNQGPFNKKMLWG